MSNPRLYDPLVYQEAVNTYSINHDKSAFQQALEFAIQAYDQIHHLTRQEEANRKTFEKKHQENQEFFANLLEKEIEEKILIHEMIDFQNTLKQEFIEEMEKLEKSEIEKKEFIEKLNTQLTQEQTAAIERQALENCLTKLEEKIHYIDNRINQIEIKWGGKTWQEGQKNHAATLSRNFGKDLIEGINFGTMSLKDKEKVMDAMSESRNHLQERLEKRVDPEKLQKIVAASYASSSIIPDALPLPTPIGPSKPQVVLQTKVLTILDHFFAARELQQAFKKMLPEHELSRWNIGRLAKYAESNSGLKEYLQKVEDFSKYAELKEFKKEIQSMAEDLKSRIEAKMEKAPESSRYRPK